MKADTGRAWARLNILCFYFAYTERRVIISEMSQFRMSHK